MSEEMDVWAVVDFGKPIQKIRQPIPKPNGTEVLIKVTHCGVCHSDLHFWHGSYDLGGGKTMQVKDRGVVLPIAMGHEILGKVAGFGPEVSDLQLGAKRIVFPWLGCGDCPRCDEGRDNMCPKQRSLSVRQNGGFAEYVLLPHPKYLADPGDVDPAIACTYGCSGITTMNAVNSILPTHPDGPIVLIGAGGLGLAAISMLRAKGHRRIVSVDIDNAKLEAARKAGATAVVNSSSSEPFQDIIHATDGYIVGVIDFVNNATTSSWITSLPNRGCTWVQVGLFGGLMQLSLIGVLFKAVTIRAVLTGDPGDLQEVAKMGRDGNLPPLLTSTMAWDEAPKAVELLQAGMVTGRLVLVKD